MICLNYEGEEIVEPTEAEMLVDDENYYEYITTLDSSDDIDNVCPHGLRPEACYYCSERLRDEGDELLDWESMPAKINEDGENGYVSSENADTGRLLLGVDYE